MKIKIVLNVLLITVLLIHPFPVQTEPLTQDNDHMSIPEPSLDESGDYIWSDGAYYMSIYQIEKILDLRWLLTKLRILPKQQSENTNALGEVPNSAWFTNRHETRRLSQEELARGPGSGIPPKGKLKVIKGKSLGINPGFVALDEMGRYLFIKFDPPQFPSLGTNADVIASRFLYAAGYNVPEYYQAVIDPKVLVLSDRAKTLGKYKKKRKMTQKDLDSILARAPKNKNGELFGNISIGLPGIPKGSLNYLGVRKDDPNDTVRHENRRELRGLRVIMSWLNNTDSRRGNTLDVYVNEDGKKFIKHFLIDFSASFGSGNIHPKRVEEGHEYFFDPGIVTRSLSALGLWVKPWEKSKPVLYPEIGRFESATFNPKRWRGSYANPAFEKMTSQDAFWAAKIVTAFTDNDIRAIAKTGSFITPGAKEHIVNTLIARRDNIGKTWMNVRQVNPLDRFQIQSNSGGEKTLTFRDVPITRGYEKSDLTLYRYKASGNHWKSTKIASISLNSPSKKIKIKTSRNNGKTWGKSLKITLDSEFKIIKIKR